MYNCEIESCNWQGNIRTRITNKESKHFNKKCCPLHAKEFNEYKEPQKYYIKPITKKTQTKRKEERKGLSEFFQEHVDIIINNHRNCENCGQKLQGNICEVAHILPKSKYKSVMTDGDNVLYLCSSLLGGQGCHEDFDSNREIRSNMEVYSLAKFKTLLFKDKVEESGKLFLELLEK